MSEAKHTPGPWRLERNVTNYRSGAKSLQVRGLDNLIATFPGTDCDAANARLIAAAPELLETLQRIKESARTGRHEEDFEHIEDLAAAAIAKATGSAA